MGNVEFHKDLVPTKRPEGIHNNLFLPGMRSAATAEKVKVLGGGLWQTDKEAHILYLWGASADFGPVTAEQIKEALDSPDTWISRTMIGWKVQYSPYISKDLPNLATFIDIGLVKE